MERICNTGIKVLGRTFNVERSGAIILVNSNGLLPEVVWWPSTELAKEIARTYETLEYFVDEDGYLCCKDRTIRGAIKSNQLCIDFW